MFPRFFLLLAPVVMATQLVQAQAPTAPYPVPAQPTAAAPGRVQQMRADLNQMESLMNNMQSEINFLRDQNLQILLNTNVRMWTILIRDLRRQLDDEEQRHPATPPGPQPKP
jgi:hypothetical protein